jgi:Alternative oxidase
MIMEALGGDQSWWVRFVAQHSAIVYYFVLCALFALSPSLSYRFSELLETHAVNTYTVFLNDNEQLLKELPPVNAAVNYYSLGTSDPFYAEFQIASVLAGSEVRTKWSLSSLLAHGCYYR